jgi:hypothetical protein
VKSSCFNTKNSPLTTFFRSLSAATTK